MINHCVRSIINHSASSNGKQFPAALDQLTDAVSMMFMVVLVGCIGTYYQRGAVASAAVISYMAGGTQMPCRP